MSNTTETRRSRRAAGNNGPALLLEEVRKVYPMADQEVVALDGINLGVDRDEIVALVGPSGSGKTTLCTIAGGILSASEGRVVVGDEDITDYSARQLTEFRRTSVGFVFQSVNLVPFLTARENLQVVSDLGPGGLSRADARRRADGLLEELGLKERANNLPAQLSGGQKQRVAIGRALMNSPELVLFDEPTSALDSTIGDQVVQLIREEMKQRGKSAIIVTHDERITHYADRTVRIEDGRVVEDGCS
ncbi:MAG TPA: ABC transporter ATP-binding protein [Actinomycetaceae bacterium]|nr:ABC transporter ATP-binding protein [Actinomycetaceae bacterium]